MEPFPFPAPSLAVPRPGRRPHGQSLVQLTLTLAVAGTLIATAVPAMQDLMYEQRLVTQVNGLFADLQLARSEAIKRVAQIILCKSGDGSGCSTESDWQDGWIVFVDTNENEAVDSGETMIRVQQALDGDVALRFGKTGTYRYVRYNFDGTAWPNATFTFCDARGASGARAIIMWNTGRARISDKDSSGGSLSCS